MTPEGKSVKAEIIDFNSNLGQVTLKRQNGKRVKVKPSIFVEADQEYIKQWASFKGFRSESLFKISCEDKLVEKWKEVEEREMTYSNSGNSAGKMTVSESKFERYVYELNLENRSGIALSNLRFEYCIFYEQDIQPRAGKIEIEKKVESGKIEAVQVAGKEKKILLTNPIVLRNKEYMGEFNYGGAKREKESGDLKGIWLRIFCTTDSGQTVTRNVFEPSSIEGKYSWK